MQRVTQCISIILFKKQKGFDHDFDIKLFSSAFPLLAYTAAYTCLRDFAFFYKYECLGVHQLQHRIGSCIEKFVSRTSQAIVQGKIYLENPSA